MCRKISSTEPKLWLEAMWPYSNPLSTCNINAVVITFMPTYIHTSPFLIFTGGDPGTRLDITPSAVNDYMPVATHRNDKINCSYSSLPQSMCLHMFVEMK